jgi:threo-3-hydroxy-L-aspartate ammonia-lyase
VDSAAAAKNRNQAFWNKGLSMPEREDPNPTELSGVTPDPSLSVAVTLGDIERASAQLAGIARQTPVHTSRTLDTLTGCSVFLKCENFQRTGAFKFRGAYNALSRLPDHSGVLTYSSGNHAQAVALSAALLGHHAVIVMPENAPHIKLASTRGYLERGDPKSRVVTYDQDTIKREDLGREIAEREGLTVIPPYDHPEVIAGQGTAARELLQEVGPLDALFVPCGGGGLLSGSAVAAGSLAPGCRVIGVEPEAADDAARSFETGHLHTVTNPSTIADGARTPSLGRYTFALVTKHVSAMMTVTEAEIARATLFAWERLKLVIEPSGALGLAGLLRAASQPNWDRSRVGVLLSGGNVDPSQTAALVTLANSSD